METLPFLTRLALKNYRSIAKCDLALGRVTFLVGANGSGKSNCLDALRLISDALRSSLDHALRERGGIREVRRRSSGHPTHFAVRVEFQLPDTKRCLFAFEVGAKPPGEFVVKEESCRVGEHHYTVREGIVEASSMGTVTPPASADRLYLVNAAGLPQFRAAFDALSHPIGVVACEREFEAWFLAAATSLRGARGLPLDLEPPAEPEKIRNAKRWLDERMPTGYSETADQPAFTAQFSLEEARRASSFDKLWRELQGFLRSATPQ